MSHIQKSEKIANVLSVHLKSYADERGRFMETFRREWFPQRGWEKMQSNRSDSHAGVLRGLHYHHHQVDYWYVPKGLLRVGMVDLRPSSPTYLQTETMELGDGHEIGLFIPVGVAHGFVALTDVTLTYIVDNYYNGGADENGVAWNDPQFDLDWGIEDPIVSQRDQENLLLKDITADNLPK
mgnify:FL=1